jgi:hypothetical protein
MRGRRLAAALLLGLLAAGAAASVDDYGQLPHLDELAISPEGTHLAFARTDGDERVVSVISLPDRQPLAAFKIGAERLRSLQWADENRLLILTSRLYAPIVTRKMSGFEAPHFSMGTPAAAGDKAGVGSTAMLASPVLSVGHPVTLRRDSGCGQGGQPHPDECDRRAADGAADRRPQRDLRDRAVRCRPRHGQQLR